MSVFKRDGVDGVEAFPTKKVVLYGTAAIVAGDTVSIDATDTTEGLGGSVIKAISTTAAHKGLAFGIACETITAAGTIKVQTAGKYENANVHGDTAAGDVLFVSATAGRAAPLDVTETGTTVDATIAAYSPVSVALEADAANLADVMVLDKGWF